MTNYLIYPLCLLLIQTPVFMTGSPKLWAHKQKFESPSSYESLEILPYISSKLADRTAILNERLAEEDKLISLFSNTKNEVKDAEAFLSEMLRVLKNLFSKQPYDTQKTKVYNGQQNIAWSYYDDLGK